MAKTAALGHGADKRADEVRASIGRPPRVATVSELDREALIDALTGPRNALVKPGSCCPPNR
ncbi:hypothetical protein E2F48_15090 [Arthrobacter crusticola]|uniref:Uncharacterized protein n=1 Tax=Arthrobacter crusticola TaxID=2547960 RepID=A0A4R5TR22_9MICC|nr:hypothetical protein E2F48_15090 [Arthrobacter crusticola]